MVAAAETLHILRKEMNNHPKTVTLMQIEIELGEPNTFTNISIGRDVMQPALVNGPNVRTAASNVIMATRDIHGPEVRMTHFMSDSTHLKAIVLLINTFFKCCSQV